MFCKNCGNKLLSGSTFCPSCGTAVKNGVIVINNMDSPYQPKVVTQKSEKQLVYAQIRKMATKEMLKGFGWLLLGIAITVFTAGFLLTYGLIVYGGYGFFRGLFYFAFPSELVKKVNV